MQVDRRGRIVLPKRLREKYSIREGVRLIVVESVGRICLVPVKKYENPTAALYGSVKLEKPIDDPKQLAREYIRRELVCLPLRK